MFRAAFVGVLVLSSSANAQSFPDATGSHAVTAKPARVSLTADGPWLPTPVTAKTYLTIHDDSTHRPRFGDYVTGARLLFHVDRDALETLTIEHTFVQPSESAAPGKDLYRSVGFVASPGTPVALLTTEKNGLVQIRISTDKMEVTGFVRATSIGIAYRYGKWEEPPWKSEMTLPKSFVLLDKPKGTPFVTVNASLPQDVMVLKRASGFALVRIWDGPVGWVAAKELRKVDPNSEDGGEEGGVEGGVMGGDVSKRTLANGTPLFDRIDGTFIGVTSFFQERPLETKGDWTRYSLATPYGTIAVWASRAIGPAPPPPPMSPPQNVPPGLLEGSRIAGEKILVPDEETKKLIAASKKDKLVGSWKLCLDTTGAITTIKALKSTGFPAYDKIIEAGMALWKYKPYQVNGKAVPVCTAITFIYSQK